MDQFDFNTEKAWELWCKFYCEAIARGCDEEAAADYAARKTRGCALGFRVWLDSLDVAEAAE